MTDASADDERATGSNRLGLPRTIATGFGLLSVAFGIWGFWTNFVGPIGVDFVSFWAAGKLTLAGHASAAYDIAVHRHVEQTVVPHVGLLPFPYPPPFLIAVTPFALAPFTWAFVIWIVITCIFYVLSARSFAPWPYALANPPGLLNFLIGQTGFLTSGLFLAGLALLQPAPFVAGAILGLLIIKPQLALLLPVAMLAGRQWRAIAGAILSISLALLTAFALFGLDAYRSFLHILPTYVGYMRNNSWEWIELASPFAFLRYLNVAPAIALAAQMFVASVAALVTFIAWWRNWEEKIAILAAATLLMSPYLLTYDALLLIVPAALCVARKWWWRLTLLWVLSALPIVHFYGLYEGPNTIPVAALLSISFVAAPHVNRRIADRLGYAIA